MSRPKPPPAMQAPVDAAVTPDEVTGYLTEVMRDENADARLRLRAAELLGRHFGLYRDRDGFDFGDLAEQIESARARLAAQRGDDAETTGGRSFRE